MNRLALTATIGAVLVAAILGLIYAVSKQDEGDTPDPAAQTQPANPPAAANQQATTAPAATTQPTTTPAATANQQTTAAAQPTTTNQQATAATQPATTQNTTASQSATTVLTTAAPQNTATTQPTQNTTETPPAQPAQSTASAPAPAPAATNSTQSEAQPPAAPPSNTQVASAAITPPAPAPVVKPSFDVVRVNPNGDAVVAGRAAPGAKITLLDNGQPVGSAEADDRGEWVLLPDSAVDPGQHKFSLKAEENGQAQESEKEVIVVVPKPAEDIAGQPVDKPSGALAIEVPKEGEAPTQLLNSPGSAAPQPAPEPVSTTSTASSEGTATPPPPPLSLDTIDYTQDGRAMLSGHTLPGSDLIIYLDNASLGATKADQSGRWTFTPETKAPIGDHELRADLVDGGGKVLSRVKVPFAQPDFSTLKLTDDTVIVQPGNSLWRIARRTYGTGVQYTVIYEANKDRIVNPDLIFPGQIFSLPQKKSGG